ncbi:MAG: 2OG-Fe(II) oxygenase [Acidimicrobiales bacterium]
MGPDSAAAAIDALDWAGVAASLDARGWATAPLLSAAQCAETAALYDEEARFRATVDMAAHRFGVGEYRYFAYPLPALVADLRERLYPRLAPIAQRWAQRLAGRGASPERYPDRLEEFLAVCAQAGQTRPTPLLLRYGAGGYNCLHQDLYGEVAFPLQAAVNLSAPGRDYAGGEFLLVENRPRAQSKGSVVPLGLGEAVFFATRHYPAAGARGPYRAAMRHGVSELHRGERRTLGVIFHDAR